MVELLAKSDINNPPVVLNVIGDPLEYIKAHPLATVIKANVATNGAIF